jgi:hypothetical protein
MVLALPVGEPSEIIVSLIVLIQNIQLQRAVLVLLVAELLEIIASKIRTSLRVVRDLP